MLIILKMTVLECCVSDASYLILSGCFCIFLLTDIKNKWIHSKKSVYVTADNVDPDEVALHVSPCLDIRCG